jgi:hypothetical protein
LFIIAFFVAVVFSAIGLLVGFCLYRSKRFNRCMRFIQTASRNSNELAILSTFAMDF